MNRKNGIEGLKSQIGKHRGSNKGRPKGSCKPKTTIEELQRENLTLQENLRLAKRQIAEMKLEKQRDEHEAENPTNESWGGY